MKDFAQQTLVENGMLRYLVEGLRSTLAWKVQGTDLSRKLSTLRFIAHSFQRHMERLMTLEECGAYMDEVLAENPNLAKKVEALRGEHNMLRKGIREIIQRLEHVSPADLVIFTRNCDELAELLTKLDKHHEKEADVFHEAFEQVEGGGD